MLKVLLIALGLAVAAASLNARAEVSPVIPQSKRAERPDFRVVPPAGHCLFDVEAETAKGLATGYRPGLDEATSLLALYVPCEDLRQARAGETVHLPEWVSYEMNTQTFPSDDERSLGTAGAVEQLCRDAMAPGHAQVKAPDFAAKVREAHGLLSLEKPVVWFGVVAEQPGACLLSALRLETSTAGMPERVLMVTAFMQSQDRWIYRNVRAPAPDATRAEDLLLAAKEGAKIFVEGNK
jgi:hypothetical protein